MGVVYNNDAVKFADAAVDGLPEGISDETFVVDAHHVIRIAAIGTPTRETMVEMFGTFDPAQKQELVDTVWRTMDDRDSFGKDLLTNVGEFLTWVAQVHQVLPTV